MNNDSRGEIYRTPGNFSASRVGAFVGIIIYFASAAGKLFFKKAKRKALMHGRESHQQRGCRELDGGEYKLIPGVACWKVKTLAR